MSKTDKDDPMRPLSQAANAACVLGVLLMIIGALVAAALFFNSSDRSSRSGVPLAITAGLLFGLCVVPGVLLLVVAGHLKQRKAWAAILLIVLASLIVIVSGISVAGGIIQIMSGPRFGREAGIGPLIFWGMVLLGAILLIVYSAQSLKAIAQYRRDQLQTFGFAPVMPIEQQDGV